MVNKINLTELEAQISSRQLSASEQPTMRSARQEEILEDTWQTLADIYGSSLVSQYGPAMPEAWVLLLKGVTPRQIKDGLNALTSRGSSFPPNGSEFRNLCLGITVDKSGNDTTHYHKSAAYLSFDDPKHPEHKHYSKAKRIEHSSTVSKRKQTGNESLKNLKDLL